VELRISDLSKMGPRLGSFAELTYLAFLVNKLISNGRKPPVSAALATDG
jgi:hypothetical protein